MPGVSNAGTRSIHVVRVVTEKTARLGNPGRVFHGHRLRDLSVMHEHRHGSAHVGNGGDAHGQREDVGYLGNLGGAYVRYGHLERRVVIEYGQVN